jgi:putative spermidine/putrescine transport system permease protein
MRSFWSSISFLGYVFLVAVYAFVYAPVVVVLVGAFNSAPSFPSPFQSFTLHWIQELLVTTEFADPLRVSLIVAIAATLVAILIAVPAAFALVRGRLPARGTIASLLTSPLIIPQIVLGVAMLQVLSVFRIRSTMFGLVLIHALFIMPYVLRAMMASLSNFNMSLEEAAMSLGATRAQTLALITFPLVRTGLVAGFVLAFLISFINVPLSLFLATPSSTTLPVQLFEHMVAHLDPLIPAVGAMQILAAFAITVLLEKVLHIRLL